MTAILVSGVVGPTVAALWRSSQERNQRKFDRAKADLAELRTVLDDATLAASALHVAFHRAKEARLTGAKDEAQRMTELFERQLEVLAVSQRLALRLGTDHPVCAAFADVVELIDIQRASGWKRISQSPVSHTEVERVAKESHDSGVEYGRRTAQFSREAQRLIGSALE